MKKKAIEIKVEDTIIIANEELKVTEIEASEVSKQGTKKVRMVAKKKNGENIVIIRPADYPIEKK